MLTEREAHDPLCDIYPLRFPDMCERCVLIEKVREEYRSTGAMEAHAPVRKVNK